MSEFFFVLKTLLFTLVFVLILQLKIGGISIEARTYHFVARSSVSLYIQSAAAGGVLALKNFSVSVKNGLMGTAESFKQGAEEQKAGR